MRTSRWGSAVAAAGVLAVAGACGSGRGGGEAPPPELAVETRSCEATLVVEPFEAHTGADPTRGGQREVLVTLAPSAHGPALSLLARAGRDAAGDGPGPAGRIRSLSLPDSVTVRWTVEVRSGPGDAEPGEPPPAYLIARSVTVREDGEVLYRHPYPSRSASRLLAARCGVDERVRLALPRRVFVEVTSDPTGASLFRSPASGRPEVYLGTTPLDVELFWLPGDPPVTIRVEKSGYYTARERVYPADERRRIVLRPLPRGR